LICAKALVEMVMAREEEIYEWFPQAWKVTQERLAKRFEGRLHVSGGNYA